MARSKLGWRIASNARPMDYKRRFKITALSKQEKRQWRTSIFVNGEFWRAFDTETVVELGLYVGQTFSREELDALDQTLEKRRAVNRAVLLLSYRGRSAHEVEERLKRAGFAPDIISEAIDSLTRLGYLDDAAFAQSWMKHRLDSKLYGVQRIKQELKLKGIPDEVIAEKVSENTSTESEYERATQLAEQKLPSYKDLDRGALFRRLNQFLLRRGYSSSITYDVCKKVVEKSEFGSRESEERIFE